MDEQYQGTLSIYNADGIQRGKSWNSLLPVHPPRVSTAGKRLAHKHANKRPASCALRRFKVFGVGTHTVTRTRASRGKMRGCFSPGYPKGRERTCQTKQWLPWRHKSSVSGLLKGSGTVARVTWHADNR